MVKLVEPMMSAVRYIMCVKFFQRSLHDFRMSRPSLFLMIVAWPIALFLILVAQIQGILSIGSIKYNLTHVVGENEETDPILLLSAVEIARRIKLPQCDPAKLRSLQVVELCIKQIEIANCYISAVVATRFAEARLEAEAVDNAVDNGVIPSGVDGFFWGVPILVKECFEMIDMPYSAGCMGRKDLKGTVSAPAISQLQSRGVIVLASTNVSEACMWHESINTVYGTTRNPYDFSRTAGGSSGGCAAGISACMVPCGVTSDVGGSTRIPALYNGLFGHKPTGGAISNSNCFPSCGDGHMNRYCQLGPSSRHACDLWPLLLLLLENKHEIVDSAQLNQNHNESSGASLNKEDAFSTLWKTHITKQVSIVDPASVDISSLTVYDVSYNLGNPLLLSTIHPEQLHAQRTAIAAFRDSGAKIVELALPEMSAGLNAFSVWSAMMDAASPKMFDCIIRDGLGPMFHPWEFLKSIFGYSVHTVPAIALAMLQRVVALFPRHNADLCKQGDRFRAELHAKLDSNCIIVMPSLACPAPLHFENLLRVFDVSNTCFFNVMELPVTAVPMGLTKQGGLPTGIQIVAGHGNDFICIAAAMWLQNKGVAAWRPPNDSSHNSRL
jgi:fatty acid amide hydrolase 2